MASLYNEPRKMYEFEFNSVKKFRTSTAAGAIHGTGRSDFFCDVTMAAVDKLTARNAFAPDHRIAAT